MSKKCLLTNSHSLLCHLVMTIIKCLLYISTLHPRSRPPTSGGPILDQIIWPQRSRWSSTEQEHSLHRIELKKASFELIEEEWGELSLDRNLQRDGAPKLISGTCLHIMSTTGGGCSANAGDCWRHDICEQSLLLCEPKGDFLKPFSGHFWLRIFGTNSTIFIKHWCFGWEIEPIY